MKEELTIFRSDLKEKDDYLKNKLKILKDRSRRNNNCTEGIPDSEKKVGCDRGKTKEIYYWRTRYLKSSAYGKKRISLL